MSSQASMFPEETRGRKKAVGPQADCIRFWEEEWLKTRGYKWAWTPKHAKLVAEALKLGGSVAEFEVRARNLLTTTEPFLKKAAAPGLLVSQWNHPIVARRPPTFSRPSPPSSSRPSPTPQRASLPEGWGARLAANLRNPAGLAALQAELLQSNARTSGATSAPA